MAFRFMDSRAPLTDIGFSVIPTPSEGRNPSKGVICRRQETDHQVESVRCDTIRQVCLPPPVSKFESSFILIHVQIKPPGLPTLPHQLLNRKPAGRSAWLSCRGGCSSDSWISIDQPTGVLPPKSKPREGLMLCCPRLNPSVVHLPKVLYLRKVLSFCEQ